MLHGGQFNRNRSMVLSHRRHSAIVIRIVVVVLLNGNGFSQNVLTRSQQQTNGRGLCDDVIAGHIDQTQSRMDGLIVNWDTRVVLVKLSPRLWCLVSLFPLQHTIRNK